jgi:hypothetical protein
MMNADGWSALQQRGFSCSQQEGSRMKMLRWRRLWRYASGFCPFKALVGDGMWRTSYQHGMLA